MKDFSGKIAVVTGGGSGIGRALVRQLTAEGCSVAMCDISAADMAETERLAAADAPQGVKIISFVVDVADEDRVNAFRDHVLAETGMDHIHLLFNNAGISGGGSFINASRAQWERTFGVCWYGVYNNARAFLPLLIKADEGHIVNVSSVNGFWASLGPETPHTAYSTAKFAVKGFTEALITDLAINAPHVKASVVMPGHIGTSIGINTMREFDDADGIPGASEADAAALRERVEAFRDSGLRPEEAATIILDGVRAENWRILVGPDALALDAAVRAHPEKAYGPEMAQIIMQGAQVR